MKQMSSSISCNHPKQHLKTGLQGDLLPPFNLLLTDGNTTISTGSIPLGNPVVLLLFSPHCLNCRALTESIVANMSRMAGIRFYFVTPCPLPELQQFCREYHLEKYTNVVAGMDLTNFFLLWTNTSVIPYTAIYDHQKRLKLVITHQPNDQIIREMTYRPWS